MGASRRCANQLGIRRIATGAAFWASGDGANALLRAVSVIAAGAVCVRVALTAVAKQKKRPRRGRGVLV